jgi:serine/threonine-protein kinase
MSSQSLLVDPYADTLEMPVSGDFGIVSAEWEHEQIVEHLGAQYQVVREIGRGGMGVVFLARDIALHRLVAIKVLRYEFASSEDHRERFRREARMTARLSHPNIVPVHTFGEAEQFVYIVMKYVHGQSLAERLRAHESLSTEETRRILYELSLALDYAHREGVVHRDLKAENILLEGSTGRPMLTDFGVALQRSLDPVRAEVSRAFGTPHYMSPEQAAGAAKHVAEPHRPLAEVVPQALREHPLLVAALERCLAKDRDTRWRHGRDLASAVADPVRKRWLRRARAGKRAVIGATLVGGKIVAELALFAAAMRAAFRWS